MSTCMLGYAPRSRRAVIDNCETGIPQSPLRDELQRLTAPLAMQSAGSTASRRSRQAWRRTPPPATREWCAETHDESNRKILPYAAERPVSDMSIAGHRPAILLYNHSSSPSGAVHLEQRARRAATGGYSGGGCRGLLPVDRDRRRRRAGATESSEKDAF